MIHSMKKNPMNGLTIGKLARITGVTNDTILFYERNGLIGPVARSKSNYRIYNEKDAERLRFIRRAKNLGFTLNEIRELLNLSQNPYATRADIKKRTLEKKRDVNKKICELIKIRAALEHLARECDGEGTLEGCSILPDLTSGIHVDCGYID